MKKPNLKTIWWAITALYIALLYATLGRAPAVWKNLNASLGGRGVIAQYLIYSLAGLLIFIYILFIKKEKTPGRYLFFLLCVGIFFVMIKFEKNPGEKIHMLQYGVLGVILYNALRIDFDRWDKRLYLYGGLISLFAGALDEVIQGILPGRCFTRHDVFINGLSGILALLLIRFNILRRLPPDNTI